MAKGDSRRDPFPYHGALRRADGMAPFNHYLWPLDGDWYWANRELRNRYSSRWNFCVVALADGRWLSDGRIRHDETEMHFFATRHAAMRHAAARLLRTIRHARKWDGVDHVSPTGYVALVRWVFGIICRPVPKLTVKAPPPPPAPPPLWNDLPLFREGGQA